MNIYDKATWHIDAGENENDVITRFSIIFDFLNNNKMLNADGIELLDLGIDDSISLHDGLLNSIGNDFLIKNYEQLMEINTEDLNSVMKEMLNN